MKFNLAPSLMTTIVSILLMMDTTSNYAEGAVRKDNLKEIPKIEPEDWPTSGPWIVSTKEGDQDKVANAALSKFNRYNVRSRGNFDASKKLRSKGGFNAVVIEGVSKQELSALPEVLGVYPDLPRYAVASYSWGPDRSDQESGLDQSYNPDYPGCGASIYILDTGLDTTHSEFTENQPHAREVLNVYNGYGSISDNTDVQGHGTHVAGSAGGATVGIAPCAHIYGMKILDDSGSGTTSGIIAAMEVVKQRALAEGNAVKTVINMSLGGYCGGTCPTDPLNEKVEELYQVGIMSVVAAGNDGENAASYSPASAPNAITVGASTTADALIDWSNFGSGVDINAPGVDINSACSSATTGCTDGNSYVSYSGTSMASPHVAGSIAAQMEKAGNAIEFIDAAAVDKLRGSLLCDSVKGIITHNRGSTTTYDLMQIPKNDGKFNCQPLESVAPTFAPTGPSYAPTAQPSFRPTYFNPIPSQLPPYEASNTNSARQNTVNEDIYVCNGETLTFSLCDGVCSGDTYLRLYLGDQEIADNDDKCNVCSSLAFSTPSTEGCNTYTLRQGCYGSGQCSGTVKINRAGNFPPVAEPTNAPAASPVVSPVASPVNLPTTAPVAVPTNPPIPDPTNAPISNPTKAPIGSPTEAPISLPNVPSDFPQVYMANPTCLPFSLSGTSSATQNTQVCSFYTCPGTKLAFDTCHEDGKTCSGDTFLRLLGPNGQELDSNDDRCGLCSSIRYEFGGTGCATYSLVQGCHGDESCNGEVKITIVNEGPGSGRTLKQAM